jgi:hypothetical protein
LIVIDAELEQLPRQVSTDDRAPVTFTGWLPLLRIPEGLTGSAALAAQRLRDQLDA